MRVSEDNEKTEKKKTVEKILETQNVDESIYYNGGDFELLQCTITSINKLFINFNNPTNNINT